MFSHKSCAAQPLNATDAFEIVFAGRVLRLEGVAVVTGGIGALLLHIP